MNRKHRRRRIFETWGLYVDDDGLLKCKGRLNTRRVSKFENPAKGRPQTSSLRSAVIRQNVNKMARERGL